MVGEGLGCVVICVALVCSNMIQLPLEAEDAAASYS